MKQDPQDKRLIERMAPRVLCRDGFLGDDDRSLGEIIDADRSVLAGLGVTSVQIAARLKQALDAAVAAMGRQVSLGRDLTAVYVEAMGRIPCPWGHGQTFSKGELRLTDARGGRTICFTPLSVHLIGEHGFFQGRGGRYRLEPAQLVEMFDLARHER